jgi:hypothetical protein
VDEYENLVNERVAQAEARAEQIRRGLSPEHDTAGELRAQRALDRAIRKWDSHDGPKLAASVREDLLNADPTELAVLAREAAPYLESRGVPSSFVEPVLGEKVPELAQAEAELKKAKQAQTVTRHNASTVRNAIREGRLAAALADVSNYDPDALGGIRFETDDKKAVGPVKRLAGQAIWAARTAGGNLRGIIPRDAS